MRVLAKIGSYKIMVLIDNGSTHNFISTQLANQLQLPIKPTAAFSIRVAIGEKLTCQGKFKKVQIVTYCLLIAYHKFRYGLGHSMARIVGYRSVQLEDCHHEVRLG